MAEPPTDSSPAAKEGDNEGEQYLLLDEQTHAGSEESYTRVIKKITSQNGVQNGARLSFHFDPAYHQLTIHEVVIRRDGKTLNRLELPKFKVIQQETGLERHLFNGSLSAVLFVEDVRVGDVIEYASTRKGANPILKGRFASSFSVEWSSFLKKQSYRLLWPTDRKLTIKNHKTEVKPAIQEMPGLKEYRWELKDLPALTADDSVPTWYEKYGWVQLTEFSTWKEVVDWALPLYQSEPKDLPEDLRQKIALWRLSKNPEEQVGLALKFVQDEVRYLGIEVGPGSHQPNQPGTVFARRFGDCKDKAFLFCTILRELGVEAHPMLVNTYDRKQLVNWAPSPFAFNHVVAQVTLGEKVIWLDATRSYQRGPLTNIYFPEYGRGLVIAQGSKELTEIKPGKSGWPLTKSITTFTIQSYTNPIACEIISVKEGLEADAMREELADTRREELEKSYLNYEAKLYPKIKRLKPIEVLDDQDLNIVTVKEYYEIPDAWELDEDKKYWTLEFYPDDLYEMAQKPETSIRTMPLRVPFPKRYQQTIKVLLPEHYNLKNESTVVQDGAVRFERKVEYAKSTHCLTLNYNFDTKADSVTVEEVPEHLKKLKHIRETLSFGIQHTNGKAPPKAFRLNWSMVAISFLYTIIAVAGAGLLYWFRPKYNPTEPPPLNDPLQGIGGWLVLVAIGLLIRPFMILAIIASNASAYFSAETWSTLTIPGGAAYDPLWGPLLMFELLGNITLIMFCILVQVLFFQKRFAFPRFFIAFMVLTVAVVFIDEVGTNMVIKAQKADPVSLRQLSRTCLYAVIWSLYMLKSRRVKVTFVR